MRHWRSRSIPRSLIVYIYILILVRPALPFVFQAQEWLFFKSGTARATVFIGTETARTFDFSAGDTAVFPSNAGTFIFILPLCFPLPKRKAKTKPTISQNLISLLSGHYIENTSPTEELHWFELYKSDRVADISLTQWLALVPPEVAAQTLNVSVDVVSGLKKEKQILLKGI